MTNQSVMYTHLDNPSVKFMAYYAMRTRGYVYSPIMKLCMNIDCVLLSHHAICKLAW